MTTRTARVLLVGVVVATSLVATRYYDGHDFIDNIWAPIRGVLAGLNPWDPADLAYAARYRVPIVAGFYLPAALLLHAPLALLSAPRAADAMAVLNAGLIWLGVLVLIPARSPRECLAAALAGALVLGSAAAQDTIDLGQLSGAAFAGLAILVASIRDNPSAVWLPAVGASLVGLKPQSAIPMAVALALLGYWRVFSRAAALLVVASLPGGVLFLRAAGSLAGVGRVTHDYLNIVSNLPPVDLANPVNVRTDALGLISQLQGPALTGGGWMAASFLFMTALFALALRKAPNRDVDPRRIADPWVATLLGVYVLTSLYHMMYDPLLLFVGPLAAAAQVARGDPLTARSRIVLRGGGALAAAGIGFRVGMRLRMASVGLPVMAIRHTWLALPTSIGLVMVVWGVISLGELRVREDGD